jgi:protein-disulfide isomerase
MTTKSRKQLAARIASLTVLVVLARAAEVPKPQVVAIIDGESLSRTELQPLIQIQLRQLRNQEYEVERRALDDVVNQRVLAKEAASQNTTPEKLLAGRTSSQLEPTEGELTAFYLGQKDRINRPFADVKPQLRQNLMQLRADQAKQIFLANLREKYKVAILLAPPRVNVTVDDSRAKGNAAAPLTIVEFSDFQCPYCRQAQATVAEVMSKYPGRIRLAFRDYPLAALHPQAQLAAEASRCAAEQGKFWEYHDRLFANQNKLSPPELLEHARALQLDDRQFDTCLQSGKNRPSIDRDRQEGSAAGVNATPAFFLNGILLSGAQPAAAFAKILEQELAAARLSDGR